MCARIVPKKKRYLEVPPRSPFMLLAMGASKPLKPKLGSEIRFIRAQSHSLLTYTGFFHRTGRLRKGWETVVSPVGQMSPAPSQHMFASIPMCSEVTRQVKLAANLTASFGHP